MSGAVLTIVSIIVFFLLIGGWMFYIAREISNEIKFDEQFKASFNKTPINPFYLDIEQT